MNIFFVVEGVVYFVQYEDLAEFFANLRPAKLTSPMDEGEVRCVWFHGGTEASSIFIVQQQQDFQILDILAARFNAQVVWYAGQLFDLQALISEGRPFGQ